MNAKTETIAHLNRQVREQDGQLVEIYNKYYCLKREIEHLEPKENEELEKQLIEENKQLQQKLTLADKDIEKYQKELAKCSSVDESENKSWHEIEKVNKLEQELKAVRGNFKINYEQFRSTSNENIELREKVAKSYCLTKKIEDFEEFEKKLSEENKQLQQKLTLAVKDVEKYQKELAKCSSVHEKYLIIFCVYFTYWD